MVREQEASWIIILKYRTRLGYKLIVSVGQIPENTEWAGIEIGYSICQILEFWIELYLSDRYLRIQTELYPDWYRIQYLCEPWVLDWVISVGQIPENTDWAVSGLILDTVFVWTLSSGLSCICQTDTWEYRLSCIRINIDYSICVNREFWIELYLWDRYQRIQTEPYSN